MRRQDVHPGGLRGVDRGLELLRLRQIGVAADRRFPCAADQGVLAGLDLRGDVLAVAARQQGGQVLTGAVVLLLGGLAGDGHGDALGGESAELLIAAAPQLGQHQVEGLLRGVVGGDQLDGDLDLVDGAGKGQLAFLPGVVHAGPGGAVHSLVADRDVVGLSAGAGDLDTGGLIRPGGGDGGRGKADLGGLGLIVVGDHQGQSVAHVAELTALTGCDGKQAHLRQLGKPVVQGRDPDVFYRLALGEGQVEAVDVVIVVKDQLTVAGIRLGVQVLRDSRGLRHRLEGFAHHGRGAGQNAVVLEDAAEVQTAPDAVFKVPDVSPGQDQLGAVGVPDLVPDAVALDLPAVAVCGLGDGQLHLVLVFRVLGGLRHNDGSRGGRHPALGQGDAKVLIVCQGIRVFILDFKVLLAGRGVVVHRAGAVGLGGDGGCEGDLRGDAAHCAAQTEDRDQDGLGDRFSVLGLRAGLAHVGLVGAEGKGAVWVGFVPVLLHSDLAVGGVQECGLLALGNDPRCSRSFLRPDLQGQDRSEHAKAEQRSDQTFDRVFHGCFPPFSSFFDSV